MTAFLTSQLLPWVVGVLGSLAAIFGVYRKGKKKAASDIKQEQVNEYLQRIEQAREVDRDSAALGDAGLDQRLSEKGWLRE